MYHTQVTWPSQSSAVGPQVSPEGTPGNPIVPAMDVYESKEEIFYIFAMPGIDFYGLQVEIQGGNLAVSAPVLTINPQYCTYRYQERGKGMMGRVVSLIPEADPEGVCAEIGNGILELRFPKKAIPDRTGIPSNSGNSGKFTPYWQKIQVKVNCSTESNS